MEQGFNFVANIPLIILAILFLGVFILFLRAGFVLWRAQGTPEEIQRGRKLLANAFYSFFAVLLISLVSWSVSYFVKGRDTTQQPVSGDFPASPAANFPSSPSFIKLGDYYFQGPFALNKNNKLQEDAVYSILCKRGESYDIIFVDVNSVKQKLLLNKTYNCWLDRCGGNIKDLYLAVFWLHPFVYGPEQGGRIRQILQDTEMPSCSYEQGDLL